jgi:MAD, mothers against decapentaplegic interacting protein
VNGQDELVFVLKCQLDENKTLCERVIPKQILYHIIDIYEKSSKGSRVGVMNHLLYDFEASKRLSSSFLPNETIQQTVVEKNEALASRQNYLLDNKENVGFLYFRPTSFHHFFLKKYISYLPNEPFLIGYLIQKWEVPWAKLFPLRLLLRLGEEFDCKFMNKYYKSAFSVHALCI